LSRLSVLTRPSSSPNVAIVGPTDENHLGARQGASRVLARAMRVKNGHRDHFCMRGGLLSAIIFTVNCVPIGGCLCFKPVSASSFPDRGFASLHQQGSSHRRPRISTAITPGLRLKCMIEKGEFQPFVVLNIAHCYYLVISMTYNAPPAIAQARIAQAKRASLRVNQREASCAWPSFSKRAFSSLSIFISFHRHL
jgi:hypothetical protein